MTNWCQSPAIWKCVLCLNSSPFCCTDPDVIHLSVTHVLLLVHLLLNPQHGAEVGDLRSLRLSIFLSGSSFLSSAKATLKATTRTRSPLDRYLVVARLLRLLSSLLRKGTRTEHAVASALVGENAHSWTKVSEDLLVRLSPRQLRTEPHARV